MLRYFVILKCEVVKQMKSRDTEVLTAGKDTAAAVLCDTEV